MTLTDQELKAFKLFISETVEPYSGDGSEEVDETRTENNKRFMLYAYRALPDMIDELLELRKETGRSTSVES